VLRDLGVKRSARHVGESVFDYDALEAIAPVMTLSVYVAQICGFRTVHPCHISMAAGHINGKKRLTPEIIEGLIVPKKRKFI
jgi:hypothetical protein